MRKIINVHFQHVEEHLLTQALNTFYEIRNRRDIQKKPSTSELIDWIRALELGGISSEKIKEEIPFAGVLLKKNDDLEAVKTKKDKKFSPWS